jgi:hypothetical protein
VRSLKMLDCIYHGVEEEELEEEEEKKKKKI